ncbi:hypothetical protein [uncultured Jannaschia sp.]|uniref:hypothetical protein n=1 Tax=uncultured Jannaschia sp. TaxID=293347 RepID=UPI00260C5880|nr:hypothetical protein [uncultured Jannaschia sp.]
MTAPPAPAPATDAQRRDRARTRLVDGARLLPVLGAALFLLPDLVLSDGAAGDGATVPWLTYLFASWSALVGLALWIARRHARLGGADDPP